MTSHSKHQLTTSAGNPDGDVLIVGAGLAGLFLALRLAPRRCTVISPAPLGGAASSAWAQGGLAAALDPKDSPEQHAADTVAAGAGLVDPIVARLIAEEGPARVRDLLSLGVPFDKTSDGSLALSLEAAHSHPRVARVAGDLAGKAIMDALVAAVQAADHITVIEGVRAISLLTDDVRAVTGVILRDEDGAKTTFTANETVLCTGGTGGLFHVTTNPAAALGDALAMGYEAGALIADVEFVQFHPTAIDIGRDPAPLATEALRGEGATLHNTDGTAFMSNYHTLGELAPRDEVARAIHSERIAGRGALLDCRAAVGEHFPEHFPTVFGACKSAGIDPRKDMIPIAPAAHYHMGGIVSDFWGQSTLEGLSVCGECASTGAHGANRLASNSLLEAVVFAHRIAQRLRGAETKSRSAASGHLPRALPFEALQRLRQGMSLHFGVVRNEAGLSALLKDINDIKDQFGPARPLVTAEIMVTCALNRKESRGGHFRDDYPDTASRDVRQFVSPFEKEIVPA